jgi:hypothetical protein
MNDIMSWIALFVVVVLAMAAASYVLPHLSGAKDKIFSLGGK